MTTFGFKTRDMASPQGKPKIYFCCHPDDFAIYFDSISSAILSKYDCAIFYFKSDNIDYDENLFLSDLTQMQLFVMPVTRKLLESSNRAIDIEFAIAQKVHIPILPLMQEKGLEKIFNRRCGNLQFLDKYVEDLTAISYEDKLFSFLNSVLIGEELTKKIRAAFHAYIFLSYRKKDRKYARQLMDLVHSDEKCRNIAIWYDEFLVPGEDFNSAIEKALRDCDLFALAVTPRLLENENYVQTIEYPLARNCKKSILAIEMENTDRALLQDRFPKLPELVDAASSQSIQNRLLAHLRTVAISLGNNDPEHDFFIGLAYLHGIDVEVNYDIAIDLIRKAAKKGILEAVEKLAEIYDKGIGVRRDIEEAIHWQKMCVVLWRERYEKEKNEELCTKLFDNTIYLANMIAGTHSPTEAEEWYQSAKMLAADLTDVFKEPPTALFLAYQHHGLHAIRFADEKTDLEKSLDILLQIIKTNPSPTYLRCLVTLYGQLGKIYDQNPTGNIPLGKVGMEQDEEYFQELEAQADNYYQCCISTAKKLADETGSVADLRTLIEAHKRVANHYHNYRNNKEAAITHYHELLRISKLIATITDDLQDLCNISEYLDDLGTLYELRKERETAKQYYKEALDNACALVSRTQNILAKKTAAKAWSTWARMHQIEKNLSEEFECYEKVILLKREIIKESNTYDNRLSMISSYMWYGKRCAKNNEAEKANELMTKSLNLAMKTIAPNDPVERTYVLALLFYDYATLNPCISPDKKKQYLRSAIEIWDNMGSGKELYKSHYDRAKLKLQELE